MRRSTRARAPVPVDPRRRTPQATPKAPAAAAPPSQALLDAFAILSRPRTDQDALPPEGRRPARAACHRCLPTRRACCAARRRAGAWVVPVPDVVGKLPIFACEPRGKSGPREGLAVVAIGDAASGGGGALDHLVRGRSPATVTPCAGADHSMLSISGIVPDGRARPLRRQVGQMLSVVSCWPAGPFAPGIVPGRPAPVPPVAVLPARPAPPAVAPRPVPAPSVAPPVREHR